MMIMMTLRAVSACSLLVTHQHVLSMCFLDEQMGGDGQIFIYFYTARWLSDENNTAVSRQMLLLSCRRSVPVDGYWLVVTGY